MAKTLAEKLLIEPGTGVFLKNAPASAPALVPPDARTVLDPASADVLVVFAGSQAELAERAPSAISGYRDGAALWFVYPKKSSGVKTDLSRDVGWTPLESADFLAVTQVALDETWSALRFRRRSEIKTLTRKL